MGMSKSIEGLKIEAVPAYNIVHKNDKGNPFTQKALVMAISSPLAIKEFMWPEIRRIFQK